MTSDCGNHGYCHHRFFNSKKKLILVGIGAFCIVFGVTVLIVYLVLRPTKPSFTLQDASILNLNVTSTSAPTLLTSTLQVTLFSRNPNGRVGIYYQSLSVYASFQDQQITMPTSLPSTYQATDGDVTVWSPYLNGASIPIAPYLATSLAQAEVSGILLLNVRIDGNVRWKVGSWRSGLYQINIDCPAFFGYYGPSTTAGSFNGSTSSLTPAVRIRQISTCRVESREIKIPTASQVVDSDFRSLSRRRVTQTTDLIYDLSIGRRGQALINRTALNTLLLATINRTPCLTKNLLIRKQLTRIFASQNVLNLGLSKCAERIKDDESGHKHCTGQYFDYWSCVDKCVAPKLFKEFK